MNMTMAISTAIIAGAFVGGAIAGMFLFRQWLRDRRILKLYKSGTISANEAREMRDADR